MGDPCKNSVLHYVQKCCNDKHETLPPSIVPIKFKQSRLAIIRNVSNMHVFMRPIFFLEGLRIKFNLMFQVTKGLAEIVTQKK
jgi:hypothetical protein